MLSELLIELFTQCFQTLRLTLLTLFPFNLIYCLVQSILAWRQLFNLSFFYTWLFFMIFNKNIWKLWLFLKFFLLNFVFCSWCITLFSIFQIKLVFYYFITLNLIIVICIINLLFVPAVFWLFVFNWWLFWFLMYKRPLWFIFNKLLLFIYLVVFVTTNFFIEHFIYRVKINWNLVTASLRANSITKVK